MRLKPSVRVIVALLSVLSLATCAWRKPRTDKAIALPNDCFATYANPSLLRGLDKEGYRRVVKLSEKE